MYMYIHAYLLFFPGPAGYFPVFVLPLPKHQEQRDEEAQKRSGAEGRPGFAGNRQRSQNQERS